MNPQKRMLLWEQWRTAGILALAFLGVSVVLTLTMQLALHTGQISRKDASSIVEYALHFFVLYFAATLTARQNSSGHVVWDFEPRLLRLPTSLRVTFATTLGARMAAMLFLVAANTLLILTFTKSVAEMSWTSLLLPFHIYLLLQAVAWSYRRASVIIYGVFILFISGVVVYRFSTGHDGNPFLLLHWLLTHPITLTVIPPFSIALMAYGAYLDRCDEYFGPPGLTVLGEKMNAMLSLSVDGVQSPLEAHLWYEYRRVGRLLPLLTVAVSGFLLLLLMFMSGPAVFRAGLGRYIPVVALPLSAIIAGMIGRFPRSRYAQLRPLTNSGLAAAQLLAQLRALMFAVFVTACLSCLLMIAGPERNIILSSWTAGYTDALAVAVLILRPLAAAGLIAWILMWLSTGLIALTLTAPVMFLILTTLRQFHMFGSGVQNIPLSELFYGAVSIAMLVAVLALILSWWRNLHSTPQFLAQVITCLLIAAFFWFGSRELQGIVGIATVLTCGVLCILPLTALTWTIERRRHSVR